MCVTVKTSDECQGRAALCGQREEGGGGRMLSILEGGYKTDGLTLTGFADAVAARADGLIRASQAAETAQQQQQEEETEGREEVLVED